MKKSAIFDTTKKYRYVLGRQWGNGKKFVNFVLLNPSTADQNLDDPTVKSCIRLAKNWGYDGLWITNLFSFRATDPADMKNTQNPIGDENDRYLKTYAKKSKTIIVAWGNHGSFLNRGEQVVEFLEKITDLHCLKILKNGSPKHPLYVTAKTVPQFFKETRRPAPRAAA